MESQKFSQTLDNNAASIYIKKARFFTLFYFFLWSKYVAATGKENITCQKSEPEL